MTPLLGDSFMEPRVRMDADELYRRIKARVACVLGKHHPGLRIDDITIMLAGGDEADESMVTVLYQQAVQSMKVFDGAHGRVVYWAFSNIPLDCDMEECYAYGEIPRMVAEATEEQT